MLYLWVWILQIHIHLAVATFKIKYFIQCDNLALFVSLGYNQNMERFSSPEQSEVSDQELIDALKSKGVENPEVHQLLQRWTKQGEKQVVNPEDAIKFNQRRARLYVEAGYVQEGLEVLESARMQAWNEQREELFNQIMTEMDEIEDKYSGSSN